MDAIVIGEKVINLNNVDAVHFDRGSDGQKSELQAVVIQFAGGRQMELKGILALQFWRECQRRAIRLGAPDAAEKTS